MAIRGDQLVMFRDGWDLPTAVLQTAPNTTRHLKQRSAGQAAAPDVDARMQGRLLLPACTAMLFLATCTHAGMAVANSILDLEIVARSVRQKSAEHRSGTCTGRGTHATDMLGGAWCTACM